MSMALSEDISGEVKMRRMEVILALEEEGKSLEKAEEFEKAESSFRKALEQIRLFRNSDSIEETEVPVVNGENSLDFRQEENNGNQKTISSAVSIDIVEKSLRLNLARLLQILDRNVECESECTLVLNSDPSLAEAWIQRAQVREAELNLEGAENDLVQCASVLAENSVNDGSILTHKRLSREVSESLARVRRRRKVERESSSVTAKSQPQEDETAGMNSDPVSSALTKTIYDADTRCDETEKKQSEKNACAIGNGHATNSLSNTNAKDFVHENKNTAQNFASPDSPAVAISEGMVPSSQEHAVETSDASLERTLTDTPKTTVKTNHSESDAHASNRPFETPNFPHATAEASSTTIPQSPKAPPSASESASLPHTKFLKPSPSRQREDVMRLLSQPLANSKSPSGQNGAHAWQPADSELFFIINFEWWRVWCRHVDFFREVRLRRTFGVDADGELLRKDEAAVKQAEVLRLLPPGASIPEPKLKRRRQRRQSSSSSSSYSSTDSDSDDDFNFGGGYGPCPNFIDNSRLLLPLENGKKKWTSGKMTPLDIFYSEWHEPWKYTDETETQLRPNLVRGYHYEVLPREVYAALRCWYGESTPPISRRAAAQSTNNGPAVLLPLYPEFRYSNGAIQKNCPNTSIDEDRNTICGACRRFGAASRCTQCTSVYYCGRSCQSSHWPYHKAACKMMAKSAREKKLKNGTKTTTQTMDPLVGGRVGLSNLGNTCFMNSALQCLSHSTPLTRHFLSNRFKEDLNESNPLGTGGRLAKAYGMTMKEIWMRHSRNASFNPTDLKRAIATFAPRFAGSSQHDTQEFLAYLLDGLHEDLNRIQNPPYVEMPDAMYGQRLNIAAVEAWDAHCRRNQSLVMDTFYGQFKSTCVCPRCGKVSVSFDAFNHVSLEIPPPMRVISVLLFPDCSPSQSGCANPRRYGVSVRKTGCISDVKQALSKICGIPPVRLAFCDVYSHAIYELLQDSKNVSSIREDDFIAAYETDPFSNSLIHVIGTNTKYDPKNGVPSPGNDSEQMIEGEDLFGFPLFTSLDVRSSCRMVWEHVWANVRRCVLSSPSMDSVRGDDEESKARSCLAIRVIDSAGQPRPVFKTSRDAGFFVDVSGDPSILPRNSNEPVARFLGADCTNRFLLLSLEWMDVSISGRTLIDDARFSVFLDDESILEVDQKRGRRGVSLDQCFEAFTRPERLDENNKWFCSSCKKHVRAMKTMEIWKLPNILVIHLKRFEFKHSLRRDKLETFINFPVDGLEMSRHCASYSGKTAKIGSDGVTMNAKNGVKSNEDMDFVQDDIPATYDLFGVTNHYGKMGFGHYTAFARRWNEQTIESEWALFDDSNVRIINAARGTVVTPAAYVLFYRRRIFS